MIFVFSEYSFVALLIFYCFLLSYKFFALDVQFRLFSVVKNEQLLSSVMYSSKSFVPKCTSPFNVPIKDGPLLSLFRLPDFILNTSSVVLFLFFFLSNIKEMFISNSLH